jgi:asparagine synthase (glutamine-hydrolysing)
MCGIAGYINISNRPIETTGTILNMLRVQKHRGPDDSGIRAFSLRSGISSEMPVTEPGIIDGSFEGALGFNRLSILDLSVNGHQPMVSPDGMVLLTFNGEIYNAFNYKDELQKWGYRFKSTTDTEIVLALYLRYGLRGMLDRLNGMFAIVIIDLAKREIYISRDRFGIKPIYYVLTDQTFAFASEVKSFSFVENFSFRLNKDKLDEYLLFRNNLNGTLFNNIQSLTPGHYISFNHEGRLLKERFFDINKYERAVDTSIEFNTYTGRLEQWLSNSVKSQLMSDVKLGCQLSGGIDSSLVTLLANRTSDKGRLEAVSIIFNDDRFSEENYINVVTDKLDIPSRKFLLDSDYYLENLEKATWHFEAPINHPNTVAIYKLSQLAKAYVTVLLSGEGADEVFGGYSRFYNIAFPFKSRRVLHEIKKSLRQPLTFLDYFNPEFRAIMATAFISPDTAKQLRPEFCQENSLEGRKAIYNSLTGSLFDRQVKYEMLSYLPDLLIRQDKMSMAHSIENRVPFLDNELVEKSFSIPEKYLMFRQSNQEFNTEKYLLKKLASATFGNDFAFRKKVGFGIPLKEYFLNSRFKEYLNDKILPGIKQRDIFDFKLVLKWLSDLENLKYSNLEALWVAVSFEIWASIYLDSNDKNRNTQY